MTASQPISKHSWNSPTARRDAKGPLALHSAARWALATRYEPANTAGFVAPARLDYDAIVVGGGHNGLVTAAYLARKARADE